MADIAARETPGPLDGPLEGALEGTALDRLIDALDPGPTTSEDRAQIDLVKFVLDRVGLAVLRAMTTGGPTVVDAPDAQTARLLQRALAETSESRPTDRLVTVTAGGDADGRADPAR
ncbi:MAG: hypothetical protein NXI21_03610 [Alphaproteobacteria bacterium]|nr:hypothetical protein [Alphaproteobacteria bacterium]